MKHGVLVRHPFCSAALAVLAGSLFLGVSAGQASRVATASSSPTPGIGAWRIGSADLKLPASTLNLGRYSVVVINAYESPWVRTIKAKSPHTKVLMSTSALDIQKTCTTPNVELTCQSGLTMYDVNKNNPAWILLDAKGNKIVNANYPYYYVGDIGSPSYRKAWIARVTTQAKKLGFDGVSIDGVLGAYEGETGGVVPAKYPNDKAWSNAMAGFVQTVGPALKAKGLYVSAEVYASSQGLSNNNGSADGAWWKRVAPSLNALFAEYFEQDPTNWNQVFSDTHADSNDNWDGWLKLIDIAQNAGADFFGLNYGTGASTDARNMMYGKASFLLKWNGKGGVYFWDYRDNHAHNVWNANWTTDIGTPKSPMKSAGHGVFRRDYSGGIVFVNPTKKTQAIKLGSSYTTPVGTTVTSVTLAPTSAAILRSPAG